MVLGYFYGSLAYPNRFVRQNTKQPHGEQFKQFTKEIVQIWRNHVQEKFVITGTVEQNVWIVRALFSAMFYINSDRNVSTGRVLRLEPLRKVSQKCGAL